MTPLCPPGRAPAPGRPLTRQKSPDSSQQGKPPSPAPAPCPGPGPARPGDRLDPDIRDKSPVLPTATTSLAHCCCWLRVSNSIVGALMLREQHQSSTVVPTGDQATATAGQRCCSSGVRGTP